MTQTNHPVAVNSLARHIVGTDKATVISSHAHAPRVNAHRQRKLKNQHEWEWCRIKICNMTMKKMKLQAKSLRIIEGCHNFVRLMEVYDDGEDDQQQNR